MIRPRSVAFDDSRKAFTLVELLAVIAILAVLSGLIIVGVAGARQRARVTTCQSNLRQLHAAFQLFAADNKNQWPARVAMNDTGNTTQGNFVYFIRSYLPAANNYGQWLGAGETYVCPAADRKYDYRSGTSYAVNGSLYDAFSPPSLLNRLRITNPPKTILLGDGCWIGTQFTSWIDYTRLPGRTYPDVTGSNREHANGSANLLFCDGHVEYWQDTSALAQSKYRDKGTEDLWTKK